jgi:hypothetical protein
LHGERISRAIMAGQPQIWPADSTEDSDLRVLLAHWEKLRNARVNEAMPLRAVASAEIGRLLKFMHLCDVVDNGKDFRWRIVGIAAFPGMDSLTGQLVSQHPDMGARLRFPILMRAVVEGKKPVRGVAVRQTTNGTYLAESIWLPFGDSSVRQVLGMFVLNHANAADLAAPQALGA